MLNVFGVTQTVDDVEYPILVGVQWVRQLHFVLRQNFQNRVKHNDIYLILSYIERPRFSLGKDY